MIPEIQPHPTWEIIDSSKLTSSMIKECVKCGKNFGRTVFKSGVVQAIVVFNRRKYCSPECFHADKRRVAHLKDKERYCEVCGVKIHRKVHTGNVLENITIFNQRRFCGLSCSGKGTTKPLEKCQKRTQYRKARTLVMLAEACEECGATEKLCLHHINHDITNNSPENTKTLCFHCHAFEPGHAVDVSRRRSK